MNRRLTAFTSLLGLLATSPAWSQLEPLPEEDSDQRWYRVELMIFAQGSAGAAAAERWDPLPELAYPEHHRFLVYPDKVEERIASHPAGENQEVTSTLEPDGKQTIEFINLALEEEGGPDAELEASPGDTPPDIPYRGAGPAVVPAAEAQAREGQDTLSGQVDAIEGETLLEEQVAPPPRPTPWVVRPAAEQEFRGKAAYMEKRGGYEVLFHQSWLQPIAGEDEARSIIIDDSGSEARYPRLQGSVRIYVSRFLHIHTNLWLNTDGHYLPGDWRMPPPPLAPASLSIVEPVELDVFGEELARDDAMLGGEAWSYGETVTPDEGTANPAQAETGADAGLEADATEGEETEPPPAYPYRHAILLKQQRRMRSAEVHYLDHPMLGVVVKLTPLSEETLEQLGEAEAEAKAAQQELGAETLEGDQGLTPRS